MKNEKGNRKKGKKQNFGNIINNVATTTINHLACAIPAIPAFPAFPAIPATKHTN